MKQTEYENRRRIVVIGGGFAGLNLAKKIDKKRFDITIIDSNNYHSFPPLFYQIASSGLDRFKHFFSVQARDAQRLR